MTGDALFGAAATRLAGTCCLAFGWSPGRFWEATPAEVAALVAAATPVEAIPATSGDLMRLESEHG